MKAVTFSAYGEPDVLQLSNVDEPHVKSNNIRVSIRAAGVNPADWKFRRGLFGSAPFPSIPGFEFAGVVETVGDGVDGVAVGDEVLGSAMATYAELVVTNQFVAKPNTLSWEIAGGLPVVARTAYRAVEELRVGAGDTLLVHAAAGAVGSMAVQLARQRGAIVIGTASESNHQYLKSIGAIAVTYGVGLVERVRSIAPHGVTAVFDAAGRGALPDSIELAGGTERVVTIADPDAGKHGVRFIQGTWDAEALARIAQQVAAGEIAFRIARTYRLEEAAAAHRESETGHVQGKIVLLV